MTKWLWAFVLVLLVGVAMQTHAIETRSAQITAIESVINELKLHYGLSEFKERDFGISLDELKDKYLRLVREAQTLEEFYGWETPTSRKVLSPQEFRQLVVGLIGELRDGHTNVSGPIDAVASIGIIPVAIDGRLYISGFNPQFYHDMGVSEPLRVGDEIVSVDGISVQELAKRNMIYTSTGTHEARLSQAFYFTIVRPFALLRPVIEGQPVDVQFRRDGKTIFGRFHWLLRDEFDRLQILHPDAYPPDRLGERDAPAPYGMSGTVQSYFYQGLKRARPNTTIFDVGAQLNQEIAQRTRATSERSAAQQSMPSFEADAAPEEANGGTDTRRSDTVPLRPVTRLKAYMFREQGKMIGVIRIPSYSPGALSDATNEYLWMAAIIQKFNSLVDVIVVDQLSNSGGYVYLGSRTAGLFAKSKPLEAVKANMRLNDTVMRWFKPDYGRDIESGKKPNFARIRMAELYYKKLKQRWDRGENWSGFIPFMESGLDIGDDEAGTIFPSVQGATDLPVVFLNDGFSASGGDFVPAILQANRRAPIFGSTSKGLGAPVYRKTEITGTEMSFRCPYAECERSDGLPIENLGVVPDIFRDVSVGDLRNGFRDYASDAIESAVRWAKGQTAMEIQSAINAEQVKRHHRPEVEKRRQGVKKLFSQFRSQPTFQKIDDELYLAYEKLEADIKPLMTDMKDEDWRGLIFPIPDSILHHDVYLAALWRRDETVERLNDLIKIKAFADSPETVKVIRKIKHILQGLPSEVRTADPCKRQLVLQPTEIVEATSASDPSATPAVEAPQPEQNPEG